MLLPLCACLACIGHLYLEQTNNKVVPGSGHHRLLLIPLKSSFMNQPVIPQYIVPVSESVIKQTKGKNSHASVKN